MSRILGLWRSADAQEFAKAWLARATPLGTEITVHGDNSAAVRGRFDGIEADGTLRLRLENGSVRAIRAADVTIG